MSSPPNILYLHCHDAGRYVEPYGYAIPSPCLQQLAEEGVLFRQAFCVAPTCSPSRASLLTGQYAHQNGMCGLAHRGFRLNDYSHHIIHDLRKLGYQSALAGVQHIAHGAAATVEDIGYDEILTVDGGFEEPVKASEEFFARSRDKPFFLSVGLFAPHRSGEGFPNDGQPIDARYVKPPPHLPDTPETRQDMAMFQASMQSADACMGRVLQALKQKGLEENTVVIATTDHGIAFPGMKCNLTDHGTGVMLMMRGPGGFSGGKVVDAMVTHLDLYPTICDLVGLAPSSRLEGKSVLPLIQDCVNTLHTEIYAEVTFHAAYEPQRSVRTDRWKYIRRFDDRLRAVLPNCDDSLSKTMLVDHGWQNRAVSKESLYDLSLDPMEVNNLVENAGSQEILENMRAHLAAWMHRTEDPLLLGPVPLPSGGKTTSPDDYSPGGSPRKDTP